MIKLHKISESLKKEYEKDTFVKLKGLLESKICNVAYSKIIAYLSTDGILDDGKIKDMLLGDITYLLDAIKNIGQIDNKDVRKEFNELYKNFTKRNHGRTWAEKLGVKICPYCNRSYVFTIKRKKARPQYDHFFPKSKYPYLSISMYNLIPCCAVCNQAKLDFDTYDSEASEENFMYPYRDSYSKDFHFRLSNGNDIDALLGASEQYELEITPEPKVPAGLINKQKTAAKTLNLYELYNKHGDYVRDIIRTAYIYNEKYFQSLAESYPELFASPAEAKNLVYMNYIEESDWDKRVLAKLSHDIIEDCKV